MMVELTPKQKRFCDEYLIDLNATQAAIRAGYSEKTARAIGNENLTKPYIKEYIKKRMAEKDAELIADQDEVMKYLSSVMRREMNESVVVTLQKKVEKWVKIEGTDQMKKQTVTEEQPMIVDIPARLSDANRAAELLGKRYGMFTDRVNLEVEPVSIVNDLQE